MIVADAGDVVIHTTDIPLSHKRIEEATTYLASIYSETVTSMIGGDHSTAACAVRGIKEAFPNERIGILQLLRDSTCDHYSTRRGCFEGSIESVELK